MDGIGGMCRHSGDREEALLVNYMTRYRIILVEFHSFGVSSHHCHNYHFLNIFDLIIFTFE